LTCVAAQARIALLGPVGGRRRPLQKGVTLRRIVTYRPSPATIMSAVALLVASSGTSYAAVAKLLPRNSVGST